MKIIIIIITKPSKNVNRLPKEKTQNIFLPLSLSLLNNQTHLQSSTSSPKRCGSAPSLHTTPMPPNRCRNEDPPPDDEVHCDVISVGPGEIQDATTHQDLEIDLRAMNERETRQSRTQIGRRHRSHGRSAWTRCGCW